MNNAIPDEYLERAMEILGTAPRLRGNVEISTEQCRRHPGDSLREYVTSLIGNILGREMTKVMATRLDFEPDSRLGPGDGMSTRYTGEVYVITPEQHQELVQFVEYVKQIEHFPTMEHDNV